MLHHSEPHQGKLVNLACSLKAAHGPRTGTKGLVEASQYPTSPRGCSVQQKSGSKYYKTLSNRKNGDGPHPKHK